jgi:ketosteroid isomerase-like protein
MAKLAAMPEFSAVNVTGTGDLLVVRYYVTVDETIGGKIVERHAPPLIVFRKQGDNWLVVAHSNFATLSR